MVASGEQSNEEAFAWREVVQAAGGGALVGSGRPWELLDPYRATIADLDAADVIVIAGDREPRELAGVIELRIRKAIRRGARLVLVGAGGTQLDLLASERIETAPGVLVDSADAIVDRLAAAERPVLLVTDPQPLQLVAGSRTKGGLADKAGGVLPLPEAPNELGVRAAGFRDDPVEVIDRAERGELKMLVLLGDADPVSRGPHADRWRSALQRAESRRRVDAVPERGDRLGPRDPARDGDAREGGLDDEPRGPGAAASPDAPAPDGVVSELALLGELGRQLERPAADPRAGRPPPARRRRARALPRLGGDRGSERAAASRGRRARAASRAARRPRRSPTG